MSNRDDSHDMDAFHAALRGASISIGYKVAVQPPPPDLIDEVVGVATRIPDTPVDVRIVGLPACTESLAQPQPQLLSREMREAMVQAIARQAQSDRKILDAVARPQGDPWHNAGRFRVEYIKGCYRIVSLESFDTAENAIEARDTVHSAMRDAQAYKVIVGCRLTVDQVTEEEREALRSALGDVIGILERCGGWLPHEDQEALRQARAVRDGVKTSNGGAQL